MVARCPNLVVVPCINKKSRTGLCWTPPPEGILKFNVDGATKGYPGPAGIEGILWASSSNVLRVFSFSVGVVDSNLTELLAVREAF
ncbi:hypothetical protein PTKIN_Ptkin03bG0053700 [Pterospermum kingtungense]